MPSVRNGLRVTARCAASCACNKNGAKRQTLSHAVTSSSTAGFKTRQAKAVFVKREAQNGAMRMQRGGPGDSLDTLAVSRPVDTAMPQKRKSILAFLGNNDELDTEQAG
ncbi:insulin-induced protein [Metarhizium robertsii ARSEF 23]|uniref:Insulin-induced protein n=1 Tax=Metarhizium robertsii (strain ARSEF 23 / ATCC MYA-3075) TaxID=655844 RepID=A0A0B2XJ02_METRA|nr:insulin-induced protein [Metarhizium robertsii ARSEF 23]KHO11477.1 insulin-induced protein [Metarhizium robertsii ARSEF 23]